MAGMAEYRLNQGVTGLLTTSGGTFNIEIAEGGPLVESAQLHPYRIIGQRYPRAFPQGSLSFFAFKGKAVGGTETADGKVIGHGNTTPSGIGLFRWQTENGNEVVSEAVLFRIETYRTVEKGQTENHEATVQGRIALIGGLTEQAAGGTGATNAFPTTQTIITNDLPTRVRYSPFTEYQGADIEYVVLSPTTAVTTTALLNTLCGTVVTAATAFNSMPALWADGQIIDPQKMVIVRVHYGHRPWRPFTRVPDSRLRTKGSTVQVERWQNHDASKWLDEGGTASTSDCPATMSEPVVRTEPVLHHWFTYLSDTTKVATFLAAVGKWNSASWEIFTSARTVLFSDFEQDYDNAQNKYIVTVHLISRPLGFNEDYMPSYNGYTSHDKDDFERRPAAANLETAVFGDIFPDITT